MMFELGGERENRVLCLGPPICLYILANKSDES